MGAAVEEQLRQEIAAETRQPVDGAVQALAHEIRRRHADAALAVLFYGSCLRRQGAPTEDAVYDFYLLVDSYRDAYARWLPAIANRLLPPNVFYLELPWQGHRLRAKYALMSLAQFRRGTSDRCFEPMLWARFSQPARMVYARDATSRRAVVNALRQAHVTTVRRITPLLDEHFTAAELWARAFSETYRSELRTEGAAERAALIVAADPARYERVARWVLAPADGHQPEQERSRFTNAPVSTFVVWRARRLWQLRRVWGKFLNVLRLTKATFTFEGALDYVLWKVERHAGVCTAVTPWQRRHPLLAAPVLAWRLYRRGAFR